MFAIEPGGFCGGYEELAAIGVPSGVGHAETADLVFQLEVLILELGPVDAFSSRPVKAREVAPLNHEIWDYAVEDAPVVG